MSQTQSPPEVRPDARVYFAAERTLLAWIRTGLAMMGFGFVAARFGLFLRQLASVPGEFPVPSSGFSVWIGIILVLLGVSVNLWAAGKHFYVLKRLEAGQPLRFGAWSLGIIVALFLGILGLLMACFLALGLGG